MEAAGRRFAEDAIAGAGWCRCTAGCTQRRKTVEPRSALEKPGIRASVFGAANLRGYAVENTPALPNNKVTAVSVSIAANDGSGVVSTGAAVYGQVPRNDLCAGAGLYVGAPNCPKLQFDYLWNTGLAADGVTFVPNGIYTATLTATGAGLSSSIAPTFTVDNQPPSPLISSPVNGNGDYNTYQTFVVDFVSPHNVGDIGSGQTSV